MTAEAQQPQQEQANVDNTIPFSEEILKELREKTKDSIEKAKASEAEAKKAKDRADYWNKLKLYAAITLTGIAMMVTAAVLAVTQGIAVAWMFGVGGFLISGITTAIASKTDYNAHRSKRKYEVCKIMREVKEKDGIELENEKASSQDKVQEFQNKYQLDNAKYDRFVKNYILLVDRVYVDSIVQTNKILTPEGKKAVYDLVVIKATVEQYFRDNLNKDLVKSIVEEDFINSKQSRELIAKLAEQSYKNLSACAGSVELAVQHAGRVQNKDWYIIYNEVVKEIFAGGKADQDKVLGAMTSYAAFHEGYDLSKPINHTPEVLVANIKALYLKEVQPKLAEQVAAKQNTEATNVKTM